MSGSSPPASEGRPRVALGNDVVDLEVPRVRGKAADDRFLRRVLAPVELELVRAAGEPDAELFSLWAAKEAAYKVVSKLRGEPPPFVHATFEVSWASTVPEAPLGAPRGGRVVHEGAEIPVLVEVQDEVLHAVAWGAHDADTTRGVRTSGALSWYVHLLEAEGEAWSGSQEALTARLSAVERDAVHSRASAAVRLGARAGLASALGVEESRLEIVCAEGPRGRRPPMVLLDGERAGADVSLSHHGRWIAWALWTGGAEPASFG